jgi:hypothetical protein
MTQPWLDGWPTLLAKRVPVLNVAESVFVQAIATDLLATASNTVTFSHKSVPGAMRT